MTHARRALAATALVAGAVLAGCAAPPGTAAMVEGTRISSAEVDAAAREWAMATGEPLSVSQTTHLLVTAELLRPIATEAGAVFSDSELSAALDQVAANQPEGAPEEYSAATLDLARFVFQQQALAGTPVGAELTEAYESADIEINPRYGTFDLATGEAAPTDFPWLTQD
ncbi:hypothetical protein [Bogoriella caseilytica]|uniref:SurA-like protein n=1 Tax=Bogoriella caseilytica TaxID=56055 RepID=A0A3N2BAG3_9MICO|nr:hypothetical protein [Bogoriella caseilytica]ROR72235.1 hypothetical protein EDD31_0584 [Bogoriella caseilytica]